MTQRGKARRFVPWFLLAIIVAVFPGIAAAEEWKVLYRVEFGPDKAGYVLTHGETTLFDGEGVIAGTGTDRWARVDFRLDVPVEVVHPQMRIRYEYRIDTDGANILRGTHHPRTTDDKVGIVAPTDIEIGTWMVREIVLVGMDVADHSENKTPIAVGDHISSIRFQSRAANDNSLPHTIIVRYVEFVVPAE